MVYILAAHGAAKLLKFKVVGPKKMPYWYKVQRLARIRHFSDLQLLNLVIWCLLSYMSAVNFSSIENNVEEPVQLLLIPLNMVK